MADLLDRAVVAMRQMSPGNRESLARAILIVAETPLNAIEPESMPFVLEGLAQIERGEFATDEDVAEAFRSFDR